MGALSPTHWLIIAGVLVLLFGAKKMPDFARSIGQSMRIIKAETNELREHTTTPASASSDPTPVSIAAVEKSAATPLMQPTQTPVRPSASSPS